MIKKPQKIILFSRKNRPGIRQSEKTVLFSKKKDTTKNKSKKLTVIGVTLLLLIGLYCIAIFSNIPFIRKWRDIYIETAMDTYSHKWLATLFIPKSVIDSVMSQKESLIDNQQDLVSVWSPEVESAVMTSQKYAETIYLNAFYGQLNALSSKAGFLNKFTEIDQKSFDAYILKNPELLENGYGKILINEAGPDDSGTSIVTKNGDQVVVIDSENGIIIVEVTGEGFVGKLAMIKNAAQVKVGVSEHLGSYGQTVETIAKKYHAILAINASGFADPEWRGNGGSVVGLLISNGKTLNKPIKNGYLNIGFSEDNHLYIGVSAEKAKYRDAVEFIPALIINGEVVTDGSTGFGIQPRSAIGQAADGTVFLLTVDGRQIGYSLGCTVGDCADILQKYGAVQASNLDGGSSTIMVYRDEVITKPSSATNAGRYVPDAFIVEYATADNLS